MIKFVAGLFMAFSIFTHSSLDAKEIKVVQTDPDLLEIFDPNTLHKMEALSGFLETELSKYSYDFGKMSSDVLENVIDSQIEYADILQEFNANLDSIYFSRETNLTDDSAQEEVSAVTKAVIKKCGLIKKFTNNCLDKKERLLFQAEYLNEKILNLEIQKTTLLNGIQFELEQEDPDVSYTL